MTLPSTPQDSAAAAASVAVEAATATPEQQAFRRSLRETAFGLPPAFGPVPERIQVSYCTTFCGDACTCSLAAEYRQSVTACCPRETIPDSCSCPEDCQCTCADCDCPACWNCGTPYARRHEDGCDACDA